MNIFKRFFNWLKGGSTTKVAAPEPVKPQLPSNPRSLNEYENLYNSMVIRPRVLQEAQRTAELIKSHQARYEEVSATTGVPWYFIGILHSLEADLDFRTHLHNGDSLNHRTVQVPAGRPKTGTPPFTWYESAVDALKYDNVGPMQTVGQMLEKFERFNGMGSRKHGINSPYLWSGSNHYTRGKYIKDGVWSSTAVSSQIGAAILLRLVMEKA